MTDKHLVLYVEDNPPNMRLVEQILKQFPDSGFIGEATADVGIDVAEQRQPELILMDVNLQGMDGFQALAELKRKETTRHIPVVAISANAMDTAVQRGLDTGFVSYLTKPFNLQEFILLIRTQLKLD